MNLFYVAEERERETGKVGSKGGREEEETGDVRVRVVNRSAMFIDITCTYVHWSSASVKLHKSNVFFV